MTLPFDDTIEKNFRYLFSEKEALPHAFASGGLAILTGAFAYAKRTKPLATPLSIVTLISTAFFAKTLYVAKKACKTDEAEYPFLEECACKIISGGCTILPVLVTAAALFALKQLISSMISGLRH